VFYFSGILLFFLTAEAFAQNGEEYTFRRISRLDGLSSDEVHSIYQDRRGVMWFGTSDGLSAYNGITFTVYRHRAGDSTSLPQNFISCVTEDKSGNLWVGTKDYICRFVPRGDSGVFVSHLLPTRVAFHFVRTIVDGGDNLLYIQIGAGMMSFDKRTFVVRSILDERLLGANPQYSATIAADKRGRLWMTSVQGLFVYDTHTTQLRQVIKNTRIAGAMLRFDREGLLWYADDKNFYAFDPELGHIVRTFSRPHLLTKPRVIENSEMLYLLGQSADGLIWFQFWQTVWSLNPTTGAMVNHTAAIQRILKSSTIISGWTDRTGVLWLGDAARGLAVWSPYNPKFQLWKHNPSSSESISDDYIRGIWDDERGTAWVCTQYGGLNRIQIFTGEIQHYRSGRSSKKNTISLNDHEGLQSEDLWGVVPAAADNQGQRTIWVYKQRFYCQELNIRTGRFRSIPLRPLITIFRDRDGDFWTSDSLEGKTYLGLVAPNGKRFLPKKIVERSAGRVDAMLHDRRNRIWFALYHPLIVRYDKAQHTWDTLRLTPIPQNADYFSSMMQDRAGNLWIATKGDGIYICDTNDRVRTLTEKDGLPNNNIYGIFEDGQGDVWMSCDKGVVRYNLTTKQFRQFTPDDGLQGWEFNRMAIYQTSDGHIYFGGTNGLNRFHPNNVRDNPYPPPVILTSLKVFETSLANSVEALRLPYTDNTLSFEFAALDFTAPHLNKYSWRLEGFDSEWSAVTSKHETKYTNLPPGEYVFRVRACNSDGLWNEDGIALPIVIEPAWYQTWWFRLLCGLIVIVSVMALVRWRVRVVEARNRLLEVEVHNRTKELRLANNEIQRQLEVQDEQAKEIELRNTELSTTLQDLKITQSQLVQSERMNAIGMLTAGVMHEINNPNAITYTAISQTRSKLQGMTAYFLGLLDEESRNTQEVKKFEDMSKDAASHLELAAEGARRIRSIVTQLQGFTKHQEAGSKTGNLATEIRSTIDLFRLQFKNVQVTIAMPDEITVVGNFGELNQVFLNLLVNAAQADADVLKIEGNVSTDHVIVSFSDNGVGMNEAVRRRIFEPFYSTKGEGNSGLGLSISKQIVERHGGSLSCESEIGRGTDFIVALPIFGKSE
jgi:signal transduction histidine kinase/ligand-binding sensor domain-containing protein